MTRKSTESTHNRVNSTQTARAPNTADAAPSHYRALTRRNQNVLFQGVPGKDGRVAEGGGLLILPARFVRTDLRVFCLIEQLLSCAESRHLQRSVQQVCSSFRPEDITQAHFMIAGGAIQKPTPDSLRGDSGTLGAIFTPA